MPNELKFKCRKCGHEEAFDDALKAQIIDEYNAGKLKVLAEREQAVIKKEQQFEEKRSKENTLFQEKLNIKVSTLTKQIDDLSEVNKSLVERANAAEQAELTLRQTNISLQQAKANFDLEVARRVDESLQKKHNDDIEALEKTHELAIRSKEKSISDLKAVVDELNRKLRSESPPLLGEVAELHVEEILQTEYPGDEFKPIARGRNGADILQTVSHKLSICGSILIEVKRTKNWSNDWIPKIKIDQRDAKAELGVIITEALPDGCKKKFTFIDGVWVCNLYVFRELIMVLRSQLIKLHQLNIRRENQNIKAVNVYAYVCGTDFCQTVSSILDSVRAARDIVNAERESMQRSWAKREKIIEQVQKASLKMQADIEILTLSPETTNDNNNNISKPTVVA